MAEYTLENVVDEVLRRDFMPFEEPCEHRFSLRHRRRMKKLFSAPPFEKTTAKIPLKKRLTIVLVLVLLMALAGFSAAASFGGSFIGSFGFMKNVTGTTEVVSLDMQNENDFISDIYKLGAPPEGYVYDEYWGDLDRTFAFYRNGTDDFLLLMQSVKEEFCTEYNENVPEFTETDVKGMSGYYSTLDGYTELVWDSGEYIFSLSGKLPIEELIRAAESLCLDPNYRMGSFSEKKF